MVDCVAFYIKLNWKPKVDPLESRRQQLTQQFKEKMHVAGQFVNTMATGDDAGVGEQLAKLQDLIFSEISSKGSMETKFY